MNLKQRWKNLVAVAVSVCFALVLGEVLLRYVFPQSLGVWSQTRDGLILLRPSFKGYSQKFHTHIHTNALGFRDVERDLGRKKGTYRILLLGDSFMEALQVEFEESFPHLLEKELNRLMPCDVEVINAAVSGWGTDDQVTYLSRRGRQLHPHLVLIAFTLHNDVSDNLEERYHLREGGKLRPKPVNEASLFQYVNREFRSYMVSHSHLYQLVYQSWKSIGAARAGGRLNEHVVDLMRLDSVATVKNGWWITKQLLAEANRLSKLGGAHIAVFSIPLIYQVDGRAYADLLGTYQLSDGQLDPNNPGAMLLHILEEENIPRVDILPEFRREISTSGGQPLYIRGDGHWNRNGHRVAVSAASRQVADIILRSDTPESRCKG
jgi:hypothetical protein